MADLIAISKIIIVDISGTEMNGAYNFHPTKAKLNLSLNGHGNFFKVLRKV